MTQTTLTIKDEYIEEVVQKVFNNSPSMRKYFIQDVSNVFKTQDGFFIPFDKPRVETSFCFSYDECDPDSVKSASKACDVKKEAFFERNLRDIETKLKRLQEEKIYLRKGYKQDVKAVTWVTEEYKERFPTETYFDISESDIIDLIEMQKEEITKFKKRLETYFKRYGTTKLKTWTYSQWD